ncbi:MAG: hypothetical protein B6I18_03820 [Bacteroidetes bacterium 4572_112]|nr:MAG: hypothetical protein B6I18_03820 [Bacteroidetes bacterium 4572_112]
MDILRAYKILQITDKASKKEIKQAYRKLAISILTIILAKTNVAKGQETDMNMSLQSRATSYI